MEQFSVSAVCLSDIPPRELGARFRLLKTQAESKPLNSSARKALKGLCDRGRVIAAQRNLAIHGQWAKNTENGEIAAVSWFKAKPGAAIPHLRAIELPSVRNEISTLAQEVLESLTALGFFLPPSPHKSP